MSTRRFSGLVIAFRVLLILPGACLLSGREPARRIHDDLHNRRSFVLENSVSPRVASADDLGALPATSELSQMMLHFRLSAAQQADLEGLLKRQRDRHSRDYRKWLTPEDYASRYGMAESDLQRVRQWLQSNGLTVTGTARSKTWIAFAGIAADVENAFATSLHRYSSNGVEHFANSSPIALPAGLNGIAGSVRGLNDFRPLPRIVHAGPVQAQTLFTSGISGSHFLAPDDFATIYDLKPLYGSGIDGTGQKIAIVGQTDIVLTDVRAFRQAAGLSPNDPQVVLYGTDPGTHTDEAGEANLDLEWAGAVAPQATILYVNSTNVFVSALHAIDDNLASVVSFSYGSCEANFSAADVSSLSASFQQANAQGITIVAATGDSGAADCDGRTASSPSAATSATHGLAVDMPGSLPTVTGLGGTTFQEGTTTYWNTTNNSSNGSALSYIPEVAWNDTVAAGMLLASGGGKSMLFPKPAWQVGLNVPSDSGRDVPDLAFSASPNHDGYLFCTAGACVNGFRNTDNSLRVVGGASIAAPTFAGVVALLDQQTKTRQGNINPGLYSLASLSTNAFHDVTQGNNMVPCTAGSTDCPATGTLGFSAGPGYDQVTGLGSVDAYNLVTQWGTDFDVAITPTTLTVNAGRSSTATVQVSKVINFSGVVNFTCAVAVPLTNTTCSVPGTVTGSGTVTLTVANSSSGQTGVRPHFPAPGAGAGAGSGWCTLALFSVAFAGWALLPARRRSRVLAGGATLAMLAGLTACDDGGSGSASSLAAERRTAITGIVTVTASSGVESHSATVSVTIP